MGPLPAPTVDVELLERSLGYTRGALAHLRDDEGGLPTPCTRWTLTDLLVHMVDALEAVTELSLGRVALTGPPPTSTRPEVLGDHLHVLGCALLDGWMRVDGAARPDGGDHPAFALVGTRTLDAAAAVEVGALEIAVHGWDVAASRQGSAALPPRLAAALLPVAVRRVPADVRPGRFAPARRPRGTDPGAMLLAHLGRPAVGWRGADLG